MSCSPSIVGAKKLYTDATLYTTMLCAYITQNASQLPEDVWNVSCLWQLLKFFLIMADAANDKWIALPVTVTGHLTLSFLLLLTASTSSLSFSSFYQHAVAKAHFSHHWSHRLYMCGTNVTAMSFKIFSHLCVAFLLTKYSKLHPAYSSASPSLPWLLASQPYCASLVCCLFIKQPSPKLTLPL